MKTENKLLFGGRFFIESAQVITLVITLLTGGCNQSNQDAQPREAAIEQVDAEFENLLSQQINVTLPLNTFILPNGQNAQAFYDSKIKSKNGRIAASMAVSGPQEKKNILITAMIQKGNQMADRKSNVFTDVSPVQTGIAYSLGSKDYRNLQSPTQGVCNRNIKFHGIDCSGFVYQMAGAAGIELGNKLNLNAAALSNPTLWQNAIQAKGEEYKKIRVEDVTKELAGQDSKLETGDIIYFYDKSGVNIHHIGVITKDAAGRIYFLNSYGNPDQYCETHFTKKGPAALAIANKTWFGYKYGVLRFITDISGKWDIYLRCNGQTYDAVKYTISFTASKNDDNVTGLGTGTDYDGETQVNVQFTGQYIRGENLLKGKMLITAPSKPSNNREDSFEIKLKDDDTGYFNANKVLDNGGCYIQLRLVNLEK